MLKKEKSSGPDGIINEIFKHSSDATIKALAILLNLILKTGQYPEQWNKSGKKCDPSNYRGISLINSVAKFVSDILSNRLKLLMKDKYSISQFGFLENHRTSYSLFILKTLINKYLHKNKKKLYLCFVDFQKAFDSVWRDGLLYKLANIRIGKYFYSTVKNMLSKTEIALKIDQTHSLEV
jgi:hypothetical protein